ncbi:fibronectin type III and SPRY domain-containing protein 1 [Terrapene carolina triunguis]|uniref:fibronectin type III and SPRY domain-containing protein 1 n=1 Tax=Terrapene triunguis TaxID=2587831 RepID=UPI000E779C2B|nr:fibronectin type III and SPRY domain-containing protein 1 [Terrapene carolina triunguis]
MGDQKDALRKIITTLAVKNEEIQNFIYGLKQMLQNVEANSTKVQEDLEGEFQSLYSLLDELKEGMLMKIKQDRASRTYELQNQLAACTKALESSEERLETANQTLEGAENHDFNQAAKQIKDSVTMAPAFRLSLKAKVSDNMSHLMVDFTQERRMLQSLKFLPAFMFRLDASTCHQNLKVEELSVEWDAMGGKVQDIKAREKDGKGRTASPVNSPARCLQSPKRMPSARGGRDRFTAESYTVLGDTLIDGGDHYWEVRYDRDSKAFGVGVAYRTLGKFDQLGKTSSSWCVHLNNWLQVSFTAKHNNKAKVLDVPVPDCIGVYCNFHEGFLSFYNARTKQLLHTFKAKFTQPVLPAFMVWCGSFHVYSGLQVPSTVKCLQKRNSATSSSNASLT